MILIPAGEFWMGTDSLDAIEIPQKYPRFCDETWFAAEFPKHKVWIDSFYIDKYEVTFLEYKNFIKSSGYKSEGIWETYYNLLADSIRDKCPITGVSWNDAFAYSNWAGKRLPTEAEWEYVARGMKKDLKYPWGNNITLLKENVQNKDGPKPVGSFPPNDLGIFDMGGNVQEWCQDYYNENYYRISPYKNPQGPISGTDQAIRGGAWFLNAVFYSRTSQRNFFDNSWFQDPTKDNYTKRFGFRCAKSINN